MRKTACHSELTTTQRGGQRQKPPLDFRVSRKIGQNPIAIRIARYQRVAIVPPVRSEITQHDSFGIGIACFRLDQRGECGGRRGRVKSGHILRKIGAKRLLKGGLRVKITRKEPQQRYEREQEHEASRQAYRH